jgi:signal-transduction protein with cAMP-binding, CBS, and nucleotidyltransferase domain
MTTQITTATIQTRVDEIMEVMTQGRFRHIPIVENEQLIGLISIGDVVKHRIAEIEHETKALRDYIATA